MKSQATINLQARFYETMPTWLRRSGDALRYTPKFLGWKLSNQGYQRTAKMLGPLQAKFANHRCIVIGNGPSLKNTNLHLLKDEFTFGLNRVYLLFKELGFETTFLASINRLVLQQSGQEIMNTNSIKFLNWHYRQYIEPDDRTMFLCPRPIQDKVDGQIMNGYIATAGTVTNFAIEIAFYMGFSEVILIGVDHSFADKGTPNKAIVTQQNDQNHFSPDYFGKGYVWQLPDLDAMELGYMASYQLFKKQNRKIVDATVNGNLQVFPKVNFEDYLANSPYLNQKSSDELSHPIFF